MGGRHRGLDYQGMVLVGSELDEPLGENLHHSEIGEEVIQGLPLHNGKHVIPVRVNDLIDMNRELCSDPDPGPKSAPFLYTDRPTSYPPAIAAIIVPCPSPETPAVSPTM